MCLIIKSCSPTDCLTQYFLGGSRTRVALVCHRAEPATKTHAFYSSSILMTSAAFSIIDYYANVNDSFLGWIESVVWPKIIFATTIRYYGLSSLIISSGWATELLFRFNYCMGPQGRDRSAFDFNRLHYCTTSLEQPKHS